MIYFRLSSFLSEPTVKGSASGEDLFFMDTLGYGGQWEVHQHNQEPSDSQDDQELSINLDDINAGSDDGANSTDTDHIDTGLAEFE